MNCVFYYRDIYLFIFIVVIFNLVMIWKDFDCLLINKWMIEIWNIYIVGYYLFVNKIEIF